MCKKKKKAFTYLMILLVCSYFATYIIYDNDNLFTMLDAKSGSPLVNLQGLFYSIGLYKYFNYIICLQN